MISFVTQEETKPQPNDTEQVQNGLENFRSKIKDSERIIQVSECWTKPLANTALNFSTVGVNKRPSTYQ